METLKAQLLEFKGTLKIILNYVITDIQKRPRSFKIGVFSVFIVVTFLTILQAGLSITPIIFIKLAENQAGDVDLMFTPIAAENDTRVAGAGSDTTIFRFLNLTDMEEKLKDVDVIDAIVPRWALPVQVANPDNEARSYRSIGLILDSRQERLKGVGRNLDAEDLGKDECWIAKNIERLLDIQGKLKYY